MFTNPCNTIQTIGEEQGVIEIQCGQFLHYAAYAPSQMQIPMPSKELSE